MKISNVGPTNTTSSVRRKEDKRAAEGFAALLSGDSETAESASAGTTQPLSMMGALIAAQMVDGDEPSKQRQMRHGKDLLDYLDQLRLDILSGGVSATTAQNLVREVRADLGAVSDPRLAEILSDIETRAAVELAKVEMSAKNHLQE